MISKLYTIISNKLWYLSLYFGELYNRWVLASQQKALGPCKCARFCQNSSSVYPGALMWLEWAFGQIPQCPRGWPPGGSRWLMYKTGIPPWCTAIQVRPRPQGFFLKKWVGREKSLCEKLKVCVTSRRAILGGLLYLLTINENFFKISVLSKILAMVIFCFPLISMKGTASNIWKTSVYRAV